MVSGASLFRSVRRTDSRERVLRRLGGILSPGDTPWSEPFEPVAAEAAADLAARHLLAPALWHATAACGIAGSLPPDLRDYLEAIYWLNVRRNARLLAEAGEIARVMRTAAVDAVFLKGTALLLAGWYPDPGARFIGDIDLLVPPDRTEDAAAALEAMGYRRVHERPEYHDPIGMAHPQRPAMVEIHRSPVFLSVAAMLPSAAVIARSCPIATPDGTARVPCATDLAMHNVLHAMMQHGNFPEAEVPLRDAWDLVRIGACADPDWAEVDGRLALGPWGPDMYAFYAAAIAMVFPGARVPVPPVPPLAARMLRRWRARDGQSPSPTRRAAGRLVEFARDFRWRLSNVPGERGRLVGRLLALHRYPHFIAVLVRVGGGLPLIPSPGRTRTDVR